MELPLIKKMVTKLSCWVWHWSYSSKGHICMFPFCGQAGRTSKKNYSLGERTSIALMNNSFGFDSKFASSFCASPIGYQHVWRQKLPTLSNTFRRRGFYIKGVWHIFTSRISWWLPKRREEVRAFRNFTFCSNKGKS